MAEKGKSQMDKYREENHSAFILGYTGGVGRALVEDLAKAKIFKKVFLIGRREVELDSNLGPEFEQKIVNFDKLDDYADCFKDLDVGFCCLGATKLCKEDFLRIDYEYVVNSAKIAKANGCKHFNLVSASGANKDGSHVYVRIKGQSEDAVKEMNFDRVSFFRPGLVLLNREESRPLETFFRVIMKPVTYFFPTSWSVPGDVLSKAMISNAVAQSDRAHEVYENKAIHQLLGNWRQESSNQK